MSNNNPITITYFLHINNSEMTNVCMAYLDRCIFFQILNNLQCDRFHEKDVNSHCNVYIKSSESDITALTMFKHSVIRVRRYITIWECLRQLGSHPIKHIEAETKMAAILQMIFSNAFSRMQIYEFRLQFQVLFLRVQFTIFQHWFR